MNVATRMTPILILALAVGLVGPPAIAGKPGGGGGGNKVSVTAASPSEALQGEELDVIVSGSGFDEGSTATYLVTGTSDDSQIQVLSNEFLPATGQLKTRVRVNGNANVNDYDIEVQNSRGRRGKGTTLFAVKSVETACNGSESKEPVIAYLTGLEINGDYETQDLMLSSASGCDHYLLLENAAMKTRFKGRKNTNYYLVGVRGLRLDIEGSNGIATWRDEELEIDRLIGLRFTVSSTGTVTPDAGGPEAIYFAPSGSTVRTADVRFNDLGQVELLVMEDAGPGGTYDQRSLVYFNVDTFEMAVLMTGDCAVQDASSNCYFSSEPPMWNDDGTEAYLGVDRLPLDVAGMAIARVNRVDGTWQPPGILMVHDGWVTVVGVRADGLLTYEGSDVRSIDPNLCVQSECSVYDGVLMPVDWAKYPRYWTPGGSLLFIDTGPGAQRNIHEYSAPFTGEIGPLMIPDVDPHERATTF